MIIKSLVEYYESLVRQGKVPKYGWEEVGVSYIIYLDEEGNVIRVASDKEVGEKNKFRPRERIVPVQVKRASGIAPNFLCDNSSYILGIDNKGNEQRARNCFEQSKLLHIAILDNVDNGCSKAIRCFFEKWNPDEMGTKEVFQKVGEEIFEGGNIVFRIGNEFAHENEEIKEAWNRQYKNVDGEKEVICQVTGKKDKLAKLHPSISGVRGGKSTGNSLVSFNASAFCSYGLEQGENAQTGQYAAFSYTTALNTLISDYNMVGKIGNNTSVLCWAENANPEYQDIFHSFLFLNDETYSEIELKKMMLDVCAGKVVRLKDGVLDPNQRFYVLGITPNAARLSVRFFAENRFGVYISNIYAHQERMSIIRPGYEIEEIVPLWKVLKETCRDLDKDLSPVMAGGVLQSILMNSSYPATLINAVQVRVRADHKINSIRAGIIKAYYLKNKNNYVPEEVLTVALNESSTNIPYILGRLFAILEGIQSDANPGINATIMDKYFGSASATPATIFPYLIRLAQKHLRKLSVGNRVYWDKQIGNILSIIDGNYPSVLNLPQQGAFQLGYYHQKQIRFQKKEEISE